MYDITLQYSGETTYQPSELDQLKQVLEEVTQSHNSDTAITVPSGALRWRDGGLWVQLSLEVESTTANVDADEQMLAETVVETGFEADVESAKEAVSSRQ
jgi:hypothetical protein